jgi:protein-S-isoprenylcysteine O-methyltransferase Ste14
VSRIAVVVWTILRVVAAVLVAGWAALHLRLLDRVIGSGLPEWLKPAGMVLLVVGSAVVLLCGGMLSTPGMIPTKVVVFGPFRYVRNPMSLGGVTMIFGFALFCRSTCIFCSFRRFCSSPCTGSWSSRKSPFWSSGMARAICNTNAP